MTDVEISRIVEYLKKADEVSMFRQAKEGPPKDGWKTYTSSPTLYIIIRIGPEDVQLENSIRSAFGIDSMGFKK